MNKLAIVPFLAGLLFTAGVTQAEVLKCGDANGKITVSGQGEVKAMPDTVLLQYKVSSLKPKPDEARQDVEKTVTAFANAVKTLKLDDGAFVADDLSIMPRYEYKDGKQNLLGYEAGRTVEVKLADFTLISKVTDLAMDSGINQIAGFVYKVSDPEKYKREAALKAINSIKEQAQMLADGFGVKLGSPCLVHYNSYSGATAVYRNNMMLTAARAADSASNDTEATYSPEPLKIQATISAEYAIGEQQLFHLECTYRMYMWYLQLELLISQMILKAHI